MASDEEFVAAAIPFLDEGVAQSHCLSVVVTEAKRELLRDALGDRSRLVEFEDWADWYRSPKEALRRYGELVKQKVDSAPSGSGSWPRPPGAVRISTSPRGPVMSPWSTSPSRHRRPRSSVPTTNGIFPPKSSPMRCRPIRQSRRERHDGEPQLSRARGRPARRVAYTLSTSARLAITDCRRRWRR